MPYLRTVKTTSGATSVQIVWSKRQGKKNIQHVGSARSVEDIEALKVKARRIIGQQELDFGLVPSPSSGVLKITSSTCSSLIKAFDHLWRILGFDDLDDVFKSLVLARIVEPTSKQDSLRVLNEIGCSPVPSYATVRRRLRKYSERDFKKTVSRKCGEFRKINDATFVLYDVTTLYFEVDKSDGFRIPGYSKERKIDPQIVIGLLTDIDAFPLHVSEFEGNKAEIKTMIPVIAEFVSAHGITNVTVVGDAGMSSEANKKAIERMGWNFILGARFKRVPDRIFELYDKTKESDTGPPVLGKTYDFTETTRKAAVKGQKAHYVHYQWTKKRCDKAMNGINVQLDKATKQIEGREPAKTNRFVKVDGAKSSLNKPVLRNALARAGWKGYETNLEDYPSTIISRYHGLWQIEKSFRMAKSDLAARPIYHHKRESIEAHITIVFAALAVSRLIESIISWPIKRFVTTFRQFREVSLDIRGEVLHAAPELPEDAQDALGAILRFRGH